MSKIAQQIKWLDGFNGSAALFNLTPPLLVVGYGDVVDTHDFVVVSAADVMFSGPETYIFPADADGNVTNWIELDGSFRGSLDMWRALRNAGYEPQGLSISA
ncbi:MAG: hypothetical protein RJA63_1584 [Pseudomonadota bacterium]|jgi:hypothetical protein